MWAKVGTYFTFITFSTEKDIAHLPDVPLTLPGENNREEKVKIEEQKIRREREAVPA